ncbi:MAG TPA: serine/threonine-protein kinase, partial [Kineosporiaceae bacterium]|nr:serine/threonine-protein kinase [Kineosporiaceae bacterium]
MDHGPLTPPGPLWPPHVPGLRLSYPLGRGAHGEVWAAVDAGTGEQVAVKLRRPSGRRPTCGAGPATRAPRGAARVDDAETDAGEAADAEAAERLAREIALLRRIDHPHVVRLRRVLDLPDGSRALVLDHAAGGSLARLVRLRGPLEPAEVSTLLVTLARALADLHADGLVHGDLAPGNVLFTGEGRPLLSDLGLGAVFGTDRGDPAWATPGFADPAAGPSADPARDLWGLGAVGWFALVGRSPSSAGQGSEVAEASGPVGGALPGGRTALVRLLLRCLDADPVRRPTAAEVARLAWLAVTPGPLSLPPLPPEHDCAGVPGSPPDTADRPGTAPDGDDGNPAESAAQRRAADGDTAGGDTAGGDDPYSAPTADRPGLAGADGSRMAEPFPGGLRPDGRGSGGGLSGEGGRVLPGPWPIRRGSPAGEFAVRGSLPGPDGPPWAQSGSTVTRGGQGGARPPMVGGSVPVVGGSVPVVGGGSGNRSAGESGDDHDDETWSGEPFLDITRRVRDQAALDLG